MNKKKKVSRSIRGPRSVLTRGGGSSAEWLVENILHGNPKKNVRDTFEYTRRVLAKSKPVKK